MRDHALSIKEQSLLLSAMLFAKDMHQILNFFPDEQRERLLKAQQTFITLPEHGLTPIILELKRLLLIDEHVNWIHESWINHALQSEPAYLRPIIKEAIATKKKACTKIGLPLSVIFSHFMKKLGYTPFRLAIYDPVLMSLQSIKEDEQSVFFATVGKLKETHSTLTALQAGLKTCAIYLSGQKYHWQQVIILSLHKDLGQELKHYISEAVPALKEQEDAAALLLRALAQA